MPTPIHNPLPTKDVHAYTHLQATTSLSSIPQLTATNNSYMAHTHSQTNETQSRFTNSQTHTRNSRASWIRPPDVAITESRYQLKLLREDHDPIYRFAATQYWIYCATSTPPILHHHSIRFKLHSILKAPFDSSFIQLLTLSLGSFGLLL